jgi:hypothetical protein
LIKKKRRNEKKSGLFTKSTKIKKIVGLKPSKVIPVVVPAMVKKKKLKMQDVKYYMNFDFYYKRTCFRTMTYFYKYKFSPFFEKHKNRTGGLRSDISNILREFTQEMQPTLLTALGDQAKEYIEYLKIVVLCHRYKKDYPYLKNLIADFSVVREPMYKYSKPAQARFFKVEVFSFLFAWFAKDSKGVEFALQTFQEKKDG